MKNYFKSQDDELCYSETYFQALMKQQNLSEIEVLPAKRQYGSDFFWCAANQLAGEKGHCSECEEYEPLNGVKGICKHNKPVYEPSNEKVILKLRV